MAVKKPLVITAGQIEQLQAGDTIEHPSIQQRTNNTGNTINIVTPVYVSGAGQIAEAQANAAGTKDVLGFTTESIADASSGGVQTDGFLVATTGQWDAVAGTTGGLSAGTRYFLDPSTAGRITATAPTASGDFVCPLGIAASTTELEITVGQTVKL